jgi:hypothetical protein
MDSNHRRHTFGVVSSYPLRSYPAVRENDLTRIRSCSLFTGPISTQGQSHLLIKLKPFFQQSQLIFESLLMKFVFGNSVPKPLNRSDSVLNLSPECFPPISYSFSFTLRKFPDWCLIHVEQSNTLLEKVNRFLPRLCKGGL